MRTQCCSSSYAPPQLSGSGATEFASGPQTSNNNPVSADNVHAARIILKKAWSGSRLFKTQFGKSVFKRENTALGDAVRSVHDELSRALPPTDESTVAADLKRLYRKARHAFVSARQSDDPLKIHEWRKQTKYLRFAVGAMPHMRARRIGKQARRIAKWLGEDHDLFVLRQWIGSMAAPRDKPVRLVSIIRRRQARMRRRSLDDGKKLFRKKPKSFVKRLTS